MLIATVEKGGKRYSVNTIYTYANGWQTFVWELDAEGVVGCIDSNVDCFYDSETEAYSGHKKAVVVFNPLTTV